MALDVDQCVVLARDLLHGTGAVQVSVLLDPVERAGMPGMVRCVRLGPILVIDGESERELRHDEVADITLPPLPEMRQLPPMDVDPQTGQVTGTIGGLQMLADILTASVDLVGGRSVIAAEFETTAPELPLGLAARPGEPVVVLIGEAEFSLG